MLYFGESISNSISTILIIGGFVVLFSVIISILNSTNILAFLRFILFPITNILHFPLNFVEPFITGLFEITNGISTLSMIPCKNISINIILTSFLLGFGGISILLQVWSIVAKTDLSIKPYFIGKLLHGIFAALYTFLLIYTIPFFNFNL